MRAYELADENADAARGRGDDTWFFQERLTGLTFRCLAHPDDPSLVDHAAGVRGDIDPWWASPYIRDMYLLGAALAHVMVDPAEALRLLEERQKVQSELRSRFGVADTYFFIGLIQLGLGDIPAAAENSRRALVGHHGVGVRRGMLMALSGAAGIAVQAGRVEDAAPILAGLRRARLDLDAPGSRNEQYAEERIARHIGRALGENTVGGDDLLDFEGTIDLALAVLDAIAHDPALKI